MRSFEPPRASKAVAKQPALAACIALACTLLLPRCAEPYAIVDLQWQVVDGRRTVIAPNKLCALKGSQTGDATTTYAFTPRLRIFECPVLAIEQECLQKAPLLERVFSCHAVRASVVDVPAADQPYLIVVDAMLTPLGSPPFVAPTTCVAQPGPRWRTMRAGYLVDLAVYQFVLNADATHPLNLSTCTQTSPVIAK